jgi:hypothetical protein
MSDKKINYKKEWEGYLGGPPQGIWCGGVDCGHTVDDYLSVIKKGSYDHLLELSYHYGFDTVNYSVFSQHDKYFYNLHRSNFATPTNKLLENYYQWNKENLK